jgi:hypothetical protein
MLIMNSACTKEVAETHRMCKESSDCVLIGTGSCCGNDTAVNKIYAKEFQKPPREMCKSVSLICPAQKAVCEQSSCKSIPK